MIHSIDIRVLKRWQQQPRTHFGWSSWTVVVWVPLVDFACVLRVALILLPTKGALFCGASLVYIGDRLRSPLTKLDRLNWFYQARLSVELNLGESNRWEKIFSMFRTQNHSADLYMHKLDQFKDRDFIFFLQTRNYKVNVNMRLDE
jgi:hypothetical protein